LHEDNIRLEPQREYDISEYQRAPNTEALSEGLKSCLQDTDDLPKNFTLLFNDQLFKFDTNLIPEAVTLYEQLGVKHEPLTLIPPQFECPLPQLSPAVFPPTMREPPPPALDQFDLDEHFASTKLRLAQLTNKCSAPADLEYFVKECGEILGVMPELPEPQRNPKGVLFHIFKKLVQFKKLNNESANNTMAHLNSQHSGDQRDYMYGDGGDMLVLAS